MTTVKRGDVMIGTGLQTRAERLAAEIAEDILSGKLSPGTRLDEQGLALRYGVSRTPVREALRQLRTSGLIDMEPHKGATVARVTADKLEEMFGAMAEIEATCARLAAIGMTPIERRRLQALHDRMSMMAQQANHAAYIDANATFHATIYGGAHNAIIQDIAIGLRRRLLPFRQAQFQIPGRLAQSHAEHDAVLTAILRADASAAHTAMLHHVSLVENAFEAFSSTIA
ncbi:MAG: GntR family transcriptional regulator [Microvirga sp.]